MSPETNESELVQFLLIMIYVLLAGAVTVHVLLTKSDVRAALGWIAVAWLSPVFGALLYFVFGINRVTRRALHFAKLEHECGSVACAYRKSNSGILNAVISNQKFRPEAICAGGPIIERLTHINGELQLMCWPFWFLGRPGIGWLFLRRPSGDCYAHARKLDCISLHSEEPS